MDLEFCRDLEWRVKEIRESYHVDGAVSYSLDNITQGPGVM